MPRLITSDLLTKCLTQELFANTLSLEKAYAAQLYKLIQSISEPRGREKAGGDGASKKISFYQSDRSVVLQLRDRLVHS